MTAKKFGLWIVGLIVLYLVYKFSTYHLERWWNYSRSYESQVTQTVCEMVKPEALKNPEKCK